MCLSRLPTGQNEHRSKQRLQFTILLTQCFAKLRQKLDSQNLGDMSQLCPYRFDQETL